jgi:hypothetical protein
MISFGMQEFYITQFNFTEKHKKIESFLVPETDERGERAPPPRFDYINFTVPFLGTRNWREGRACTATTVNDTNFPNSSHTQKLLSRPSQRMCRSSISIIFNATVDRTYLPVLAKLLCPW